MMLKAYNNKKQGAHYYKLNGLKMIRMYAFGFLFCFVCAIILINFYICEFCIIYAVTVKL